MLNNIDFKGSVQVDGLTDILLSVVHMCNNDKKVLFLKKKAVLLNLNNLSTNQEEVVAMEKSNTFSNLYGLEKFNNHLAFKEIVSNDINLWPRRLNHTNVKTLKTLCEKSDAVPHLMENLNPWIPCIKGKARKKYFWLFIRFC